MGRKSKLTPLQWAEMESRLVAGESRRAMAREYGVSETTIREHFGKNLDTVQAVAEAIVDAEVRTEQAQARLQALSPIDQISVQNLAAARKRITENFARGLDHGADTFARAQEAANSLTRKAVKDPEKNVEKLRLASGLVRLANDAMATIGGKEALAQLGPQGDDDGASDNDARREALARSLERAAEKEAGGAAANLPSH